MTGWQIFNHKGLVVRAYQPTFATTDAYSAGDTTTAVVETTYDPLGRPLRVDYPDGTYETTTYHPWVQQFADRNDNAGAIASSDERYGAFLDRFGSHVDTPTRTYLDAFGREIAVSEDNGTHVDVEQVFRVTTYAIGSGSFTGTTYDLTLKQPLTSKLLRDDPGGRLHRRPERQQHPVPRHRRSARHRRSRHLQR